MIRNYPKNFACQNAKTNCKPNLGAKKLKLHFFSNFFPTVQSFKTISFREKEFMEFSIKQNRVVLKSRVTESILKRAYLSVCTQDSFCHILGLASSLRMKWFEDAFFGYLRCAAASALPLPSFSFSSFKNTVD